MTQLETLSAELSSLVAVTAPALVSVHGHNSRSSGFVWKPGLVVTAEEALADDGELRVVGADGEARAASLAGRDPSTDVALMRVDGLAAEPVPLDSSDARVGALAVAVGLDEGAPVAALGAIARSGPAWRSMRGGQIDRRLELDLRLRPRAEGGLALDAAGRAFGMAVLGPRRRALVIPAETIARVAEWLETHGRVTRGYLGLGLAPVRVEGGEGKGAMVMSVDPQGPGAAAGVRQGDVIVRWDGQELSGVRALLRSLAPDSVGRAVQLGLLRGGEAREVTLTIGERPE